MYGMGVLFVLGVDLVFVVVKLFVDFVGCLVECNVCVLCGVCVFED